MVLSRLRRSLILAFENMKDLLESDVERLLNDLYIAAEGAGLRKEDLRKAKQVAPMLREIEHAARHSSRRSPFVLVDAAAGNPTSGCLLPGLCSNRWEWPQASSASSTIPGECH